MKICIIVGTRPEIIKMSPLVAFLQSKKINFFIIHSNQHYSADMDEIFFKELNIPSPSYNLNVGSGKHSNQTGNILIKIEPILEQEKPDYVLVQGDTNTVLAGGLAAAKLGIKVGHIEAGLRSYDRTMPEETNRVVTDHLSSFLFAVTRNQKEILLKESIDPKKISIVGNTIVDAVLTNINLAETKSTILKDCRLQAKKYILLTAHRVSNVDSKENFRELLDAINTIADDQNILWPIHPRTRKKIDEFSLTLHKNIQLTNPVGYFDFLVLQKNAKLVLTDSGGLQEESCILGTPCITLRENTERPETIEVGANILVGRSSDKLKQEFIKICNTKNKVWKNPFGDGTTSLKIYEILKADFNKEAKTLIHNTKNQKICVIGLGYMGLPMACLLANAGHTVTGVDVNLEKINNINSNQCYLDEAGMGELLTSALTNNLKAQNSPVRSDVFIISVPTPHKNNKCDLTYIYSAVDSILPYLENDNLIIIESTIRPNTCREVQAYIDSKITKKIHLCHCPERAIPGNTIHELINNDRIIGGLTPEATEKAYEVYSGFSKGGLFKTDATTAECCKLLENTFRDVNIALANEFDIILKSLKVNPHEAVNLANKHPRVNILQSGAGVGGHCISIDPWFLIENSKDGVLIETARKINDNRPIYWAKQMLNICKEHNHLKVGLLGVAYKENVDDARETPSKKIYEFLVDNSLEVQATDPYVKSWDYELNELQDVLNWADIYIIVTNHDKYINLNTQGKTYLNTKGYL